LEDNNLKKYESIFENQGYHGVYINLAAIGDISILINTVKMFPDFSDINELQNYFIESNPFHYSTRASRGRHFRSIKKLLLKTYNEKHESLLKLVADSELTYSLHKFVLYLQVGLNSKLFRELTLDVFAEKKKQGALKLTKHTLQNYILENVPVAAEWSESTIERLGTRYLSLMYMFGFIEGNDRQKIAIYSPSARQLAYAVYLDQCITDNPFINYEGPVFQLLFLNDYESFVSRLKDLSLDGFFDLEIAGGDIKVKSLLEVDQFVDRLGE